MTKKSWGKRVISAVTSAFLAVTYAAGSYPADIRAATNLGSRPDIDDLTLLVGENGMKGSTVQETLDLYNEKYALGIASQFSAFIKEDFYPTNSDTEGRLAVGGNFEANTSEKEYEVGNGDFDTHIGYDVLSSNTGYAHAVVNGEKVLGILPVSWNGYKDLTGKYNFSEKRIWVTDGAETRGFTQNYNDNAQGWKNAGMNYDDFLYKDSKIFDIAAQFDVLERKSQNLLSKPDQFTVKVNGDACILTYTGDSSVPTESIYATLSAEEYELFHESKYIEYKNIPELPEARKAIHRDGYEDEWKYAYIVVNLPQEGTVDFHKSEDSKFTWITPADGESICISDEHDGAHNNEIGVTSLLYNIPNADKVVIPGKLQGTIFAPKADATDMKFLRAGNDGANPHLSGALIAKSFEGNTEIGFRPYEGPASLLSPDGGCTIDISKQIEGFDGLTADGIKIAVFDAETNKPMRSITTSDTNLIIKDNKINGQLRIDIPKPTADKVKTAGGSLTVDKLCYIAEEKAPADFELNSDKYYFRISEKFENLTDFDEPAATEITVTTYPKNGHDETAAHTYKINAVYGASESTFTITIDEGTPQTFKTVKDAKTWKLDGGYAATPVTESLSAFGVDGNTFYFDSSVNAVYPQILFPVSTAGIGGSAVTYSPAVITDKADVIISKTDADGNILSGAQFKITKGTEEVASYITSDKPEVFGLEWSEPGKVTKLEKGVAYLLTEVNAPAGYEPASPVYFKVNDKAQLIKADTESGLASASPSSERIIKVVNQKTQKLILKKVDSDTKASVSGAVFDIYNSDSDELIDTVTVSASGTATKKQFGKGNYYIVEKTAPQYYELNAEKQYFCIDDNGNVYAGQFGESPALKASSVENNSVSEFGEEYKNCTITKIVVEVSSISGDSHEIQFKPFLSNEDSYTQLALENGTNTFDASPLKTKDGKILTFGPDGKMKITHWNTGIESITYYCEAVKPAENQVIEVISAERTVSFADKKSEDAPEPSKVKISKTDAAGSGEIPGAKLTLTGETVLEGVVTVPSSVTVSGKTASWTSGTSPVEIEGLPDGKYTLEESVAPDGYTVTDKFEFVIEGGKVISATSDVPAPDDSRVDTDKDMVILVDSLSEISVSKKNITGTKEIPGAVLTVELVKPEETSADLSDVEVSANVKVGTHTDKVISFTSAETPAVLTALPDGEYRLTETTAPDGYKKSDEVITFTVTNGKPDKMAEMKDEPSKVTISKIDIADKDSEHPAELPGAKLTLTNNDGKSLADVTSETTVLEKKDNTVSWTSGDAPTVITLLPDGNYTLTEDAAPAGYDVTSSIDFEIKDGTVVDNDDDTLVMADAVKEPSVVSISKQDIAGAELPGAELIITGPEGADLSKVTASEGTADYKAEGNKVSFTSGTEPTVITGLPDGEYTLTEITAPDGYSVAESMKFTITDGVPAAGTKDGEVIMKDEPSKVTVSKQDVAGAELPGAKLEITLVKADEKGADLSKVTASENAKDFKHDAADKVSFTSGTEPTVITGLPDGEYTLTEITAPKGYLVAETMPFTVNNGSVTAGGNDNTIVMTDMPEPEVTKVIISKTDAAGSAEVPGAHLTLTYKGEEVLEGKVSSEADITVKGNTVTWISGSTPVIIENLPDGNYTLEESVAPDGYTVTGSKDFTVSGGRVSGTDDNAVVMKDELSEVNISKSDVAGSEIPGATLTLTLKEASKTEGATLEKCATDTVKTTPDSKNSLTWKSTDKPTVLSGLPDGKYVLEESVAPDGYTVTGSVEFIISDGVVMSETSDMPGPADSRINSDTNTVTMIDELSEVTVSKIDVVDEKSEHPAELPGAVIEIVLDKPENESAVLTGVTASEGTADFKAEANKVSWTSGTAPAVIKGLPDGEYTLSETTAPDGYRVTESVKFKIVNGIPSEEKFVMKDAVSKITISKQDIAGPELPGAKLTLTNLDKKSLEKVTSESDISASANVIEWISGTSRTVLNGLPDGDYELKEETAPEGYLVAETIKFTVANGTVLQNAEDLIIMKDEPKPVPSKVIISKTDAAGSGEIPGAHLTLTGDKVLEGVITSEDDITVSENTVTWISGTKPVIIENLPDGNYTLEESVAPDGYTVTGRIDFTVADKKVTGTEGNAVIMKDELSEVNISKSDVAGNEVPGATLVLTLKSSAKTENADLSGSVSETVRLVPGNDKAVTWVSSDKPTVLKGLPDGTYLLEESVAPDGYTVTGSIEFTVTDGKASSETADRVNEETNTVTMVDELSQVTVSKQDINNSEEIPGAVLEITLNKAENDGADLSKVIASENATDFRAEENKVSFTSGTKPVIIAGLPDGEYTLSETTAPDGYKVTESIDFTMVNGVPSASELVMKDEPSKVTISKQDVAGEEIFGAELTLTNLDSKSLENVTSDSSVEISENVITWTSGDKPVVLNGIPDGRYELKEVLVPDGYTQAETITFTVENGVTEYEDDFIAMLDNPSRITVSKKSAAGSDEVPGAKLTLTADKDLTGVKSDSAVSAEGNTVSWTSGDKPVVLEGLPDGKYTLTEVQAPLGYEIAESIKFTISGGVIAETEFENNTVVMIDEISVPVTTPAETTVTTTASETTAETTSVTKLTTANTTAVTSAETTSATKITTTAPVTTAETTNVTTTAPVTTAETTKATTTAPVTTAETTKATTTAPVTTAETTKATTTAPVTTAETTKATTTAPVTTAATTKATTTAPVTTAATTKATTTVPVTTAETTKAITTAPVTTVVTTTAATAPVTTAVTTKATTVPVTTEVTTKATTVPVTTEVTTKATTVPVTTAETTVTSAEEAAVSTTPYNAELDINFTQNSNLNGLPESDVTETMITTAETTVSATLAVTSPVTTVSETEAVTASETDETTASETVTTAETTPVSETTGTNPELEISIPVTSRQENITESVVTDTETTVTSAEHSEETTTSSSTSSSSRTNSVSSTPKTGDRGTAAVLVTMLSAMAFAAFAARKKED